MGHKHCQLWDKLILEDVDWVTYFSATQGRREGQREATPRLPRPRDDAPSVADRRQQWTTQSRCKLSYSHETCALGFVFPYSCISCVIPVVKI